ncbi:LPS-assembly lipoprotein LptE [Moraxella cuniculi]|uniref:Lipopolysaccharide-assembly n=1 Tax=Moraxella cuniculi TaxID=34061 RepID=A0A3S4QTD7_9GAMM|nr:hypothetical protein [Moraxella cuniculi]VEG13878.1 Lipopolysaccharide-assembly [Moraxella cuniculi]
MNKKFLQIALLTITTATLSGCGFGLRGINPAATQLAPAYSAVDISAEDTALAHATKAKISTQLAQLGIVSSSDVAGKIHVYNLRYREYKLLGVLTEIRLVLTADVRYQLGDKRITNTVQVERSYQHNEASVATSDQQGSQIKVWLQDNLAERIAEQYHALAKAASQ